MQAEALVLQPAVLLSCWSICVLTVEQFGAYCGESVCSMWPCAVCVCVCVCVCASIYEVVTKGNGMAVL